MICQKCGNEASGRYCGNCGAEVDQALPLQVPEPVAQPVRETFFPPSPSKPPANPDDDWSILSKLRGLPMEAVVGLGVIAVVIFAVVAATLTSGSGNASTGPSSNDSTTNTSVPSAVMTTEPTLKAALADANTCVQTLNRLADEVGPPRHDGSGVMLTDQQAAAAAAILGPQGELSSPLQELWLDTYTASTTIKYGGGYSADYQCGPSGNLVSTAARLPN
jgi:hypothetical protein